MRLAAHRLSVVTKCHKAARDQPGSPQWALVPNGGSLHVQLIDAPSTCTLHHLQYRWQITSPFVFRHPSTIVFTSSRRNTHRTLLRDISRASPLASFPGPELRFTASPIIGVPVTSFRLFAAAPPRDSKVSSRPRSATMSSPRRRIETDVSTG
jgi:hypothetical protein